MSMTLSQLGSVLNSKSSIATKGYSEPRGWGPQPEALVVSGNHATSRAIPTWVAVLPHRARMSSGAMARLLLKAMTGSMVQLQLGSALMSVVWPVSPQGVIGTMHGETRGLS